MRHAYKSGARAAAPAAPAAPSLGHPTEGEPSTNIPATVPGPYWFHGVTSEIVAVIEAAGLAPDDTLTQLRDAIRALVGASVPAGSLIAHAGTTVPSGFLACDGSLVSRTTYAALYAAIGTTYGAGDGSTTFALPDLERRVIVGAGGTGTTELAATVGSTGGDETHTLTAAEMPTHDHGGVTDTFGNHRHSSGTLAVSRAPNHSHEIDLSDMPAGSGADLNTMSDGERTSHEDTDPAGAHDHTISGATGSAGGHNHHISSAGSGAAHNNLQPSIVMQWLVSTG